MQIGEVSEIHYHWTSVKIEMVFQTGMYLALSIVFSTVRIVKQSEHNLWAWHLPTYFTYNSICVDIPK